jgi:hypothetical protein
MFHLPIIVHILLGTNKYENGVLGCIIPGLFDPTHYRFVALSVCHTIYYKHCIAILVKIPDYGLESLLPGRIPYLQLYLDSVNLDSFGEEFHTDSGTVFWCVLVADVTHQQTALADIGTADNYYFKS